MNTQEPRTICVPVWLTEDDLAHLDEIAAGAGITRVALIASIIHDVVADDRAAEAA